MKMSVRWGLLGLALWAAAVKGQNITGFSNGHVTFENPNTNLYYRIEFKPNLTDPGEWFSQMPVNIRSADAEVTVPVGVFYRVAGSPEPFTVDAGGGAGGTATAADLRDGKTAWVGEVQLTGTMPERTGSVSAVSGSFSGNTLLLRPYNGFYPGDTANHITLTDNDWTEGNIREGVNLFGKQGTVVPATGNATAANVLAGKTFSNDAGADTGTMAEQTDNVAAAAVSYSGNTLRLRPQTGFYAGKKDNNITYTDDDWTEGNIREGVNLFGKQGTLVPATGNATAADVLIGKTFSSDAGPGTGTNTPPAGMVLVPGGTNSGINPLAAGESYSSNYPETYSLTVESFHMDRSAVTKVQWDEVYNWATHADRGANVYSFENAGSGKDGAHPVHTVNWYDCVKWCNARSEKDGRTPVYSVPGQSVYRTGTPDSHTDVVQNSAANGFRLPTIDEHQYASRGGLTGKRFPWGNTINHDHANYYANGTTPSYDTSPYTTWTYHPTYNDGTMPYTSPSGSFAANGYGLYDMAGNVLEWCWNAYGTQRLNRGGSFYLYANSARCGHVAPGTPNYCDSQYGFRAVFR